MEIYELENERVNLESALAAMTAERDRFSMQVDVLEAALKTTAEERDDWKRRAELARATAHSLAAQLEEVEAIAGEMRKHGGVFSAEVDWARKIEAALATTGPQRKDERDDQLSAK